MSSKSFVCVIDPLTSLNPKKDSSIAMMESAQSRGWKVGVIEDGGLHWSTGAGVRAQVVWIKLIEQINLGTPRWGVKKWH